MIWKVKENLLEIKGNTMNSYLIPNKAFLKMRREEINQVAEGKPEEFNQNTIEEE